MKVFGCFGVLATLAVAVSSDFQFHRKLDKSRTPQLECPDLRDTGAVKPVVTTKSGWHRYDQGASEVVPQRKRP